MNHLRENAKELKQYMNKMMRLLGIQDEAEKSCCGITLSQCHALMTIGETGLYSLNELADEMDLDKSTMSRTVDGLVKAGYVNRQTDEQNRRSVSIRLTEQGQALYSDVEARMDDYFEQIYSLIPKDKRGQVMESLSILFDAIAQSGCCE